MRWDPVATITVFGTPKGQPRPRAVFRPKHGRPHVYDSATAKDWKALIAIAAKLALPRSPILDAVRVRCLFFMPRPQRLRTRRLAGLTLAHTAKPDTDNLVKAVLDTLQELGFYRDDAQISSLAVDKIYASEGQPPGAIIHVYEAESS